MVRQCYRHRSRANLFLPWAPINSRLIKLKEHVHHVHRLGAADMNVICLSGAGKQNGRQMSAQCQPNVEDVEPTLSRLEKLGCVLCPPIAHYHFIFSHEIMVQCFFNVGPASATLVQH